jgi:MtfA peptidase
MLVWNWAQALSDIILFSLFLVPVFVYFLYKSYSAIQQKKRWQLALANPLTSVEADFLHRHFIPYKYLTVKEQSQLLIKIAYFLKNKNIIGLGEDQIPDEFKLMLAANACLMLVNIEGDIYPGLTNIYVIDGPYVEKDNPVNPHTGKPLFDVRLGESWKRGPIVVTAQSIRQLFNFKMKKHDVIIHEFSHHLDQQDGHFDGTPEFQNDQQYKRWARIMGREFIKLRKQTALLNFSDIDSYGAKNEAEFFAVCAEYFFTAPHELFSKHPDIFSLYLDYFKIDPRKWS